MRLRLAVVISVAVVLQAAVAPQLRVLGATPALMILVALAAGAVGGPETGAITGFAAGVGMDLLVQTPFGLWALTGAVLGWGTGHLHGRLVEPGPLSRALTAAVGTAVGVGLFVLLGSILGQDHLTELPVGRLTLALVVANVVLMPLAFRAVRWAVAPELRRPMVNR